MIPRKLGGRYLLVQELGRGATAVVYRARDETLSTDVAVKVLAPHLVRDPAAVGRFERELAAARQVASEAVAQVYELGHEGAIRYVVMEYGPTGTLKDHLLLQGPLSPTLLDRLMEQVADALAACHGRGILHRDLKPSNILFDAESGRMKLIDFGVARIADHADAEEIGSVVGTPEYMAPEQFEDPVPDPRSDLYAAGAVLYEAATGRPPVSGRTMPEVVRKHREGIHARPRELNPEIGEGAEAIILRLLAPDPGDRYQTADELQRAVAGRLAADAPERPLRSGPSVACPRCRAAREPGLHFCPSCGESLGEFDRFGRWSVLVAGEPKPRDLSRALDTRLPGTVLRVARPDRRGPRVVLECASEPLARWLAEELRGLGIAASTRRLGLGRALGLGVAAGLALTVLAQGTFAGLATVPRQGLLNSSLAGFALPAAVLLFAIASYAFIRNLRRRFGQALAYVLPFPRRDLPAPSLERARAIQRHLRSARHRAIGRDLLVTAHRLRETRRPGAEPREDTGRDELLDTGFAILGAMDVQAAGLRERTAGLDAQAGRQDALVRGTQALLRLTVLRRREFAASARRAGRALARSVGQVEVSADDLAKRRAELSEVLGELSALAPATTRPPARPKAG